MFKKTHDLDLKTRFHVKANSEKHLSDLTRYGNKSHNDVKVAQRLRSWKNTGNKTSLKIPLKYTRGFS